MQLTGLAQPPLNTTFMGCLQGALRYLGVNVSDAFVFAATGHAFVLNIHRELCPSGPYCWESGGVWENAARLGVRGEFLGFFGADAPAAKRSELEAKIRAHVQRGLPACLLNMEYQLITACDDAGFGLATPWSCNDVTPARLSHGSWSELGGQVHMSVWLLHPQKPEPPPGTIRGGMEFGAKFARHPEDRPGGPYVGGLAAYPVWRAAVEAGAGTSHGHWWNGTVWSECRRYAAEFFRETDQPAALADAADRAAHALNLARDKMLPKSEQLRQLALAEQADTEMFERIDALLPGLSA
jgi:hypothetical protein